MAERAHRTMAYIDRPEDKTISINHTALGRIVIPSLSGENYPKKGIWGVTKEIIESEYLKIYESKRSK